jgi:HAD superfamily phosphoserine phosphatase-like hydrolase
MTKEQVAVFDVDGTQFKSACVEKVIDEAILQGVFSSETFAEARLTRRRWQENNNEGVYQAYLHHLVGAFVASIANVSVEQFRSVTERVIAEHRVRLFSYPRQLRELLTPNHTLVAISGSPLPVVEPFLEGLGFDEIYGSTFEIEDGRFTGQASAVNKQTVLEKLTATGRHISVGVGDTVGDLPVLRQARCPVAFNPSATLRKEAIMQHWPIVIEQKDAITQLLPADGTYSVHFERSPKVILDFAGVPYE